MTDDNLTRAEAQERATKVSAVAYEVTLDLTTGEETFRSETVVRFQGSLVGLATFVDLDAVTVHEATLNDRPIPVEAYDPVRSRIPLRGLKANNELRVVADCAYQHTGVGLHRFVDPTDGKAYLHTQFEPFDAHRVFACFDQPDVKGTFAITVTAPEGWTVISNSPAQGPERPSERGSERDDGTGEWRFPTTPAISTYLVAVVAGPYYSVHDRHGDVELGIYCRESLAGYLDPEEIFTLTRQGLDFFTTEFDQPYPFGKYDQLFVPEFNFGAMENPGCVTFNEGYVFRSRQTDSAYERRAGTILHEMAHMWFGDLVTMRWWDDLWLNESFATYMGTDAEARATRFRHAWVRFASGTKMWAAVQDQLPSTHPISADIVDTDAVRLHFDGITYAKGASVLKQLVAWVGQDAFTEGCRRYFRRHEWGNAELNDFLGALEETSGRDLAQWSQEWLQTAGVNTLRSEFQTEGDRYTSFAILQEGMPGHPTVRSHRLAIGLYHLGDEGLVRERRVELDVIGPRTDVASLAGQTVPDLLLLNDDDLAYTKVRLDERSVDTLQTHLHRVVEPLARNLCWAALWDMVRDAELATRRFVALVAAHAPIEDDETTLARILGQAAAAVDSFGDPANRSAARSLLAAGAREGLQAADAGSDRQLTWVRHLLSVAAGPERPSELGEWDDRPDDLAWARGLLDGSVEVPGLKVDTDLRWQIVGTLATHAADDSGGLIEAELERDPTDIGERRAAACRASRPTAEAKATAWEQLVSPGLHLAEMRAIAGGFGQWGQEPLLDPYVDRYFSSLRSWWDDRSREEALTLAGGLFPSTLVRPDVVEATSAALGDDSLPGPFRRILLENRDSLERALRARAVDLD